MREIKFRGLTEDGEWFYGSLLQSEIDVNQIDVHCQIRERFANDFSVHEVDVIPETVGQSTLLTDQNGVEIFEGDKDAHGNVVEFSFGCWNLNGDRPLYGNHKNFIVAGNIHQ